ncbi:MAG TPA: DUF1134 domain-containing protein [Steroidobacteraceae bacterium]
MKQFRCRAFVVAIAALVAIPLAVVAADKTGSKKEQATYNQAEVMKEADEFFGSGAAGLADVIAKAFKEQGEPNAYIKGNEGGGAIGVGVRYGKGTLQTHDGGTREIYWQGPSIGFDVGGNAAKVFVLIYNLNDEETLFQRFPGVEGSLYFVGGVGLNYARASDVTVAPVRFGVGWRQGASVGYVHFTKEKSLNPF